MYCTVPECTSPAWCLMKGVPNNTSYRRLLPRVTNTKLWCPPMCMTACAPVPSHKVSCSGSVSNPTASPLPNEELRGCGASRQCKPRSVHQSASTGMQPGDIGSFQIPQTLLSHHACLDEGVLFPGLDWLCMPWTNQSKVVCCND